MTGRPGVGRLAIRHALLAALVGVALGAVFSILQVRGEYRESIEAERRAITQMMAVMREPAAQAGYNLNEQAAEVIVKGALSFVPVQEATLRSDFDDILARGRNDAIAARPDAWWTRFVAATQDYVLPLDHGPTGRRVGELKVVTSQAPRVERFLDNAWRDVGWTVLRSVTVALALGVLSFVTLTRPLTAIARRITDGPPEQGAAPIAEAARPDEIGQIAAAFERYEREADERTRSLATMVDDLERQKSVMARIAELNQLLQSARTEPEAFDVIRTAATRLFADSAGGFAVAGDGDEMVVVGAWGPPASVPWTYDRDACWAIRRGAVHLQPGESGTRCSHPPHDHTGSMMCSPLYVEGRLIGVLHVIGDHTLETFGSSVRRRSELFGEVVKLGLSNLRLRETLREQALRDVLTGLPNRRLFDETLPRELARCLRAGQPLTVALVDVDHFKHFNDTFGHDAGDRVLRLVGRSLVENIRTSDLASRYGGDEFMCLLPNMTALDAKARFESAQARLAQDDPGVSAQAQTITFTVGLASAPGCGRDVASLVQAADAALYTAKALGRNRVEIADPTGQADRVPALPVR